MSQQFELPRADVEAFCRKWMVQRLELFGSAVRDELTPGSDLDFLYTWRPDAHWSLFDLVDMKEELETIVGRPVDLVSRAAIERSLNWIRREHILSSARNVYAA